MKPALSRRIRSTVWIVSGLLLLFLASVSNADYAPGAGIAGTPHDFSGYSAGANQRSGGTAKTGACVFCHTPHKSYRTRLLWNHTHPPTDYNWGNYTVTAGGTTLPTIQSTWEGATVFCLSCHDGTVARGDIAWFNRRSWTGAAALDLDKVTIGHVSDPFDIAEFLKGMMGSNHPVAVPYPYLQVRNTYNSVTTGPRVPVANYRSDPTPLGIRLFSNPTGQQVVAGATSGRTGIECTSCHGAHNEKGVVVDKPFLRGLRGGDSGNLCSKCHVNM